MQNQYFFISACTTSKKSSTGVGSQALAVFLKEKGFEFRIISDPRNQKPVKPWQAPYIISVWDATRLLGVDVDPKPEQELLAIDWLLGFTRDNNDVILSQIRRKLSDTERLKKLGAKFDFEKFKRHTPNSAFLLDKICLVCGTARDLTVDHIIPVSLGGLNHLDNIMPLCEKCNRIKGNQPPRVWFERLNGLVKKTKIQEIKARILPLIERAELLGLNSPVPGRKKHNPYSFLKETCFSAQVEYNTPMNTAVVVHPAVSYVEQHGFDSLVVELKRRVELGHLTWREGKDDMAELVTVCYSKTCPIDGAWDEFTIMSRGMVLDVVGKRIIACALPKFFNYMEHGAVAPHGVGFSCLEKLDGSLIISFWWKDKVRCATKGSFYSDQAVWAAEYLQQHPKMLEVLERLQGSTFLFEAIYRSNQIVVKYDYEALVLLAGYSPDGVELTRVQLQWLSRDMDCRIAGVTHFDSIEQLAEASKGFKGDMEGYVVRFDNGLRIKIKGAEYCRIHRLVSRLTPLAVWENMQHGLDMAAARVELPEEFWVDFDELVGIFNARIVEAVEHVATLVDRCKDMSNKEVGLAQASFDPVARPFIFAARKDGAAWIHNPRTRRQLFDTFRPTANILPGWTPSVRFKNVQEETG